MRRWLITGASRGIGLAVAERAVAAGDRVLLVARGAEVEEVAARLGPSAVAVRADLTAPDAAVTVVDAAVAGLGGVDVLVNNAGVHRGGRVERLADGDFEAVLAADLVAPFELCRAAVRVMEAGAAIVNVGAVVGFRGFPGDAPYGAAKAGLAGLTTVLAVELARRGITVNLVVPGFTDTEMTRGIDPAARERIVARIPIGRTTRPDEVAEVIGWVAAARAMTGAVVPVDGGLLAALGGS